MGNFNFTFWDFWLVLVSVLVLIWLLKDWSSGPIYEDGDEDDMVELTDNDDDLI